jgi:hypothetical protein
VQSLSDIFSLGSLLGPAREAEGCFYKHRLLGSQCHGQTQGLLYRSILGGWHSSGHLWVLHPYFTDVWLTSSSRLSVKFSLHPPHPPPSSSIDPLQKSRRKLQWKLWPQDARRERTEKSGLGWRNAWAGGQLWMPLAKLGFVVLCVLECDSALPEHLTAAPPQAARSSLWTKPR